MIHLIAQYDGTNGILMFPVEQNPNSGDVEYRLRWPESAHPALREWGRVRTVTRLPAQIPLVDPAVAVEGQWRLAGDQGWEDCIPAEFGEGVGDFEIEFLKIRWADADPDLDVMGMVGDFPAVFRITLPAWTFKAPEKFTVTGSSMSRGPGQYFRPGGFVAESSCYRITGLSSQATLLPVAKAVPGRITSLSRGFMVKTGRRLQGAELDEFLKQKEVSHG